MVTVSYTHLVAQHLKANPQTAEIPIIFLTALNSTCLLYTSNVFDPFPFAGLQHGLDVGKAFGIHRTDKDGFFLSLIHISVRQIQLGLLGLE